MENLNEEQVKKAFKCCNSDGHICGKCPYKSVRIGISCRDKLIRDANILITSKEQRIKELTQENKEVKANWQKLKETQESACEECKGEFKKLTEENEKLKVIPKEMVERLKTYFATFVLGYNIPLTEALKAVNQIAKEMLEGTG